MSLESSRSRPWPSAVRASAWALAALFFFGAGFGCATSDSAEALPDAVLDVAGVDASASDSTSAPASGLTVDLVRVSKSERRLELLSGDRVVAVYEISLGSEPVGPKRAEGDGRTPEGRYLIDSRKLDSDYHRALHISYPDAEDVRRARALGVDPGGSIMIHGLPNGQARIGADHVLVDWTDGCIAVTNDEIEEIWERVRDGVPIEIRP